MREDKWHALYLRVSTDAQYEEGYSIEAQMKKLEKWCELHDIRAYEFYVDGGYSGSNLKRPEMERMLSDIEAGHVRAVVVYKLDRISRSQRDTIYLLEDVFEPNHTGFISLNENFDTTTPYGKAMIGILSVFAQLERENIRERTRMGMQERLNKGMWRGTKPPFGYNYDADKGILVPNQDADTVREIYRLYLEGMSTYRLAKMFGIAGDRQVAMMLERSTYTGMISHKGELLQGLHEPIIDRQLWEQVQAERKRRSVSTAHNSKYLLSGLLECGICHAKMRYQTWGKQLKIYCYSQQTSKPNLVKDPNCNNEKPEAEEIEQLVIQDMLSYVKKYSSIEGNVREQQDTVKLLEKRAVLLANKIKNLYNIYGASPEENKLLLETIDENKKELADVNQTIAQMKSRQEDRERLKAHARHYASIAEGWEDMSYDEKRRIVREFIKKVVITNHMIEIYYFDNEN